MDAQATVKNGSDLAAVLAAGTTLADVQREDGLSFVVVPQGYVVIDRPDMRANPNRKTGTVVTRSVKDFIELVNREKGEGTVVFCDFSSRDMSCRAVIDFHGQYARWCEYVVELKLMDSHEWNVWSAIFNRKVPQVEFAELIEERNCDVYKPSGADLLEVALTLQEKKTVEFVGGTRLQNGDTHLVYAEQSESKAGKKGDLDVPSELTLFIPPYDGFGGQFLRCVLRYRIEGGSLSFTVKPMDTNNMLRRTRDQIIEDIRKGTELLVVDGSFARSARVV